MSAEDRMQDVAIQATEVVLQPWFEEEEPNTSGSKRDDRGGDQALFVAETDYLSEHNSRPSASAASTAR